MKRTSQSQISVGDLDEDTNENMTDEKSTDDEPVKEEVHLQNHHEENAKSDEGQFLDPNKLQHAPYSM